MALGARTDVVALVTRQAAWPVAIGLMLGLVGAAIGSRALASFLVDMDPLHVPMFILAAAVFGGVTGGAAWLTARGALRIRPAQLC